MGGVVTVTAQLQKSVRRQIAKELRVRVTRANPVLKSHAPPYRDIRAQTYVYIAPESNNKVVVIKFVSDPKKPDVLLVGGRPYGKRKHYTPRVPYNPPIDLANVTNGRLGGKSKRKKKLATHGWWRKGVRAAAKTISKGG